MCLLRRSWWRSKEVGLMTLLLYLFGAIVKNSHSSFLDNIFKIKYLDY